VLIEAKDDGSGGNTITTNKPTLSLFTGRMPLFAPIKIWPGLYAALPSSVV